MAKHEVFSDGATVWVNDADGLLGRFGLYGIDIHRKSAEQCLDGECLHCTHRKTTKRDWTTFVTKMKELHDVDVPERLKPKRFLK